MAVTTTTEVYIPKIIPKMILGMPVDQFSYIMLGIGATAPAVFIIIVVIAMQCYKRRQKKKLMRLQLRYKMAQNSMENGHLYRDHRRWTEDDVVLENPILVSRKELSSNSNTARSIGGSVVIMNGSIRNNPLPDFNPQQSESTPNVFFTDISVPILQLNGKPVRLNDAMEVCSIRSNSSSRRSSFELAPSASTMHNWGFSPQESLLSFKPYEFPEENVVKTNPMLDELEGCDKHNMFFGQRKLGEEMSQGPNSPTSEAPNKIKTTAIVIENPHFSNISEETCLTDSTPKAVSPSYNPEGQNSSFESNSKQPPDLSHTSLQKSSQRYVKKSEELKKKLNKSDSETKDETPPITRSNDLQCNNSMSKSQNHSHDLEKFDNVGHNDDVKTSDENDNEHNKARRKSWLFTSYVNKAYDPGPVESENEEILMSDPTNS
ncbi:uncharacterized protein LOC135491313 [Lineus longissimus]|uniref:uncharacterized protein LOC135491313 n=1 Tax=Lineus longissimus TaxID=88925 RepID=UPI00315CC294